MYIIYAIKSPSARVEEITDETQRICDVQPFFALFKIAERQELSEDSKLNENITALIGKTLSEFKTLKNPEVSENVLTKTTNFGELSIMIVLSNQIKTL
jgi:PI3-kinase family, p85-binding domain